MYTTHVLESVYSGKVCAFYVIDVGCHVHHLFLAFTSFSSHVHVAISSQEDLFVAHLLAIACLVYYRMMWWEHSALIFAHFRHFCGVWQRLMIKCGPSRRESLRLTPKTIPSAMRSPCLMWLMTAPSCTKRWPSICTLMMTLRNGEISIQVKNTFTYLQLPLKLAGINTEGNLVGFHDKCFWNFDNERMKPTTNHTTPHPQQEASTQPHHDCAFRFYQEICCTCSSSGGGNAHLPGSTRLPEGCHHWRLCCRGTIYFPSSLLTFTGEFILKVSFRVR